MSYPLGGFLSVEKLFGAIFEAPQMAEKHEIFVYPTRLLRLGGFTRPLSG
jgi:hypothetical protein